MNLKLKKILAKLLTFWILPRQKRKNARNFIYYFSLKDFVKFKLQPFHIVSIGNNCLPRVLSTAAGLKARKIYGEKTMPFDLAIHLKFDKIAQTIEQDFSNFFDNLKFEDETWKNEDFKALYIHDNMLNKEQFVKRYKKRIRNFQQILDSNKNIIFFFSNLKSLRIDIKSLSKDEIIDMYRILKKKRKGKPFKLVILGYTDKFEIDNSDISIIQTDFILKDTRWGEYCINECKNFDNEYTKFVNDIGKKLKEIIN